MNGNWASLYMTKKLGASTTLASLALTTFWGAVTAGRILFAAIEKWFPERRTCQVLPFVVAIAFFAVSLLPTSHPYLGIVAFALAGLGCSALLPLTMSFAEEELTTITASVAGGLIAFYQIGYGIAAFGVGPLQSRAGLELNTIYGGTAIVALVMSALSFVVVRSGRRRAVRSGITVTQSTIPTSTINDRGGNVMSLKGKVAIVTGGNSGIGLSIVLELAKQGANIVIDYVSHPEATEALEKQVAALGDQVIGVKADVSKVAELQSLIDAAVKTFGRLDIMVNNAGVETRTSVLDTTEEQYEKVLSINLKSAFFGTQLAAKQMIKQGGGGRIINITSVHEDWPMPGNTAYCLSKGGMRMLTRTAGVELAPHNILVVGVGPGAVATPINLSTMKDPALMKKLDTAIPLGRMAQPEEIGSVVAFLAGDGARYITATTIFADGGIMHSSPGL